MASWHRGGAAAGSLALALLVVELYATTGFAEPPAEPLAEPLAEPPVAERGTEAPASKPRPISDNEAELGRTFQPLADRFGLTRYVYATRTQTGLRFEYLPEGETLDAWRTLGTLLLVPVGGSWEEGEAALPKYIDAFRRRMKTVNDIATWRGPGGDVWFMDYEVVEGPLREHILAAVWQLLPGTLGVFQTQRRPERFPAWQIDHFKQITSQLDRATLPAPRPTPAP